jgi:ketosteroid isomerase-like protein
LFLLAGSARAATKKQTTAIEAIQKADLAFCEETKKRGLEGWMSYFADDATAFPAGKPFITGRDTLRSFYSGMFSRPEFSLTWKPVKADAAASGDLGYTIGVAEFRFRDKDGKMVNSPGKYLTVWKKQKDGSWKVAADLGN